MILAAKFVAAGMLFLPLLYAAIQDFRAMRIANWISVLIAAGFALFAATHWQMLNFSMHLLIAAVLFAITYGFWLLGWLGGGDVKLITAVGLWLGPVYAFPFIVMLAVSSSLLSIGLLIVRRWAAGRDMSGYSPSMQRIAGIAGTGACPYGIPICLAAFATLPELFFA